MQPSELPRSSLVYLRARGVVGDCKLTGDIGAHAHPMRCASWFTTVALAFAGCTAISMPVVAASSDGDTSKGAAASPQSQASASSARFDIDQYRVEGVRTLPPDVVEEAVYPHLGPHLGVADIEAARAALEKAYHDGGFQTVSVSVPDVTPRNGVIVLKVTELKVGRVRVKNARYFDLEKIKQKAASLKEGAVPDFNAVTKDIVALNQWPDRRVTPALRAGVAPGTVDVDLNVEDKLPLHGSVEVNNRQSPNTTKTRVSATAHYDNLWQLGHSLSVTYQVAPERPSDAQAISASYLARLPEVDWLSVLLYGVKSDSDVATIGGTNVVGPGAIIGARAVLLLPTRENFVHTLSLGMDYKHFEQTVSLGSDAFSTPITYAPLVASYGATWQQEQAQTQLNASITLGTRGIGSEPEAWDAKRFMASADFTAIKADLSRTQDLPEGLQLYGKVQGQWADQPLVSSEQFSLGGLDTVRGYLESEVLGDSGVAATLELRSPDIGAMLQKNLKDETGEKPSRITLFNEWRWFGFVDGGTATINDPLPGQQAQFDLWSSGVGTRFRFANYLNGMVALAVPMTTQATTHAGDPRLHFRVWGEF